MEIFLRMGLDSNSLICPSQAKSVELTRYCEERSRRVGKANGSRERAPDDKLRVPTIRDNDRLLDGGHGAKSAFAHPTRYAFSLRINRSCLTHGHPFRLDDLEHPRKFIHQRHQLGKAHRISLKLDLAAGDRFRKTRLLRDHFVEPA